MLIFRSEDHVDRWLASRNLPRGAVFTPKQAWDLGRIWYSNRLDSSWRRRSAEEAEAVFTEIGLGGDFWRLR